MKTKNNMETARNAVA